MQHPNATQLRQAADNGDAQFRYKLRNGSYSPPVGIMTVLLDETKNWELVGSETVEKVYEPSEDLFANPLILWAITGIIICLALLGYLSYPEGATVIR